MAKPKRKPVDKAVQERIALFTAHALAAFAEHEMKRTNTLPHELLADNVANAAVRLALRAEGSFSKAIEQLELNQ